MYRRNAGHAGQAGCELAVHVRVQEVRVDENPGRSCVIIDRSLTTARGLTSGPAATSSTSTPRSLIILVSIPPSPATSTAIRTSWPRRTSSGSNVRR